MTLKELFLFFLEHREIIVGLMLLAPWLSWLICVAIPGQEEEPMVLNLNLGLALVSVLGEVGYLLYATNTGGWSQVVSEADLLLLLYSTTILRGRIFVGFSTANWRDFGDK